MKKITLLENEEIIHKVKYSNKATFFTLLLFILFNIIFDYLNENNIIAFLFMFIFLIPTLIKLLFILYRRLFQRIYITNERIIIASGYFIKFFKVFNINDVTGVFYRAKRLDKVNNAASIKVIFNNNKHFIFKKVTYGNEIAKLLSVNLVNK